MQRSGNHEVIEDEKTDSQAPEALKTEKKDTPPFKKPPALLQSHMKVTSIKETLEKHKPVTSENDTNTDEPRIDTVQVNIDSETEKITQQEQQATVSEIQIQPEEKFDDDIETDTVNEQETALSTLQECWVESIKESSTPNTIIAEELLMKQVPVENENHIIEIEVPNEVAKQEVREIIPSLTHYLTKKTGIPYSFEIKVVKVIQEKQVDKTNPDEKFMHMCKENPKLMDLKQRLNLSIS